MRYTLFALRCEMLWGAARILKVISAVQVERSAAVRMEGAGDIGKSTSMSIDRFLIISIAFWI